MTASDQPVRQALAAYQAAVLAKDVDAFVAIYADDVQIFELWGQWAHDMRTQVSGDMALLTASLTYRAVDASGQALRSLDNRLSWVLRERGGRWFVVHEHTSVPLAHDGGKGIFKRPAAA